MAKIIKLNSKRESRLLRAARAALEVLDTYSIEDLHAGKDSHVRAELIAAIREEEERKE